MHNTRNNGNEEERNMGYANAKGRGSREARRSRDKCDGRMRDVKARGRKLVEREWKVKSERRRKVWYFSRLN